MAINIIYNNIPIPAFIHVTDVRQPIINLNSNIEKVGSNFKVSNRSEEIKSIEIDFFIKRNGFINDYEKREFKCWLLSDNEKGAKLKLPNMADTHFIAVVDGSIDIAGDFKKGRGTIKFILLSNELDDSETIVNLAKGVNNVTYAGITPATPFFNIKCVVSCSEINVKIKNNKYDNFIKLVGNFNQNTIIKIDMYTGLIYVNDIVNMGYMSLDSYFHKLISGVNTYTITASGDIEISLKYRNEY